MQKTVVPQRASKPVTVDIEQEYDDNSVTSMPRSAIRFRGTQPTQRTTGPIAQAPTSNRVSGTTRLLLWVLLVCCLAFLANGLVMPMVNDTVNQIKYGDSRIATYDISNHHWITEEANGRMRIVVSNPDGSHSQQLTMAVGNAPKHALVTLKEDDVKIDVSINGAYITPLVSDGKGGYKWESNG